MVPYFNFLLYSQSFSLFRQEIGILFNNEVINTSAGYVNKDDHLKLKLSLLIS